MTRRLFRPSRRPGADSRRDRTLRPVADRAAARRQPAHGAARLARRQVRGRALRRADGGPRPLQRVGGPRGPPARRPGRDRRRLGRTRRPPERALRPLRRRPSPTLRAAGLVYECYCTRREILEAAAAPHGPVGAYPGTCRDLPATVRTVRRADRPPALRLRSSGEPITFDDGARRAASPACPTTSCCGATTACRPTTSPSWSTTPPRASTSSSAATTCWHRRPARSSCSGCSGCPSRTYLHVPLVVGDDGQRLAKRHGAVTLEDLAAEGVTVDRVVCRRSEHPSTTAVGREPIQLADLQRSWS